MVTSRSPDRSSGGRKRIPNDLMIRTPMREDRDDDLRQEVLAMLVITRREGEEVVIGDPSSPLGVVRVAVIKGDRVRLAFEFPREVDVHRREIADQIMADEETPSVAGQIRPASEA